MTSADLPPCPLCGRVMLDDSSVDEHHPVPKSRGGREKVRIHRVCHTKIHSRFSEKELAAGLSDFSRLRADEDIARFIRWVRKKPPGFKTRHARSKKKRR